MSIRETVGSFSESHRAKCSRPDRRNFLPQAGRLPSALRFFMRFPDCRSTVLKSSRAIPNRPAPVPFFPIFLQCKSPRPHWMQGRPQRTGVCPQFFCDFPHCTDDFPQFPDHFPQFFSRRTHLQWSVPQPFMRISSSQPSNSQLKTDYEP